MKMTVGPGDESLLGMGGADSKARFEITNGTKGQVGLNAWDAGGRYRIGLGIFPNGDTHLTLVGADGKPLLRFPPNKEPAAN
jgi:hypothetical protein